MRTVQVKAARELTPDQQSAWASLQASNPSLDSAFYTPDLTQLVALVRDDIEVAIMMEDGEAVGFFPYLHSRDGRARPVAGRLTEFHGPVTRPNLEWDLADLIRKGGLRSFYFDHLPAHPSYVGHSWTSVDSPYADLREGFDAYESALRQRGGTLSQIRRKERKISREVGPLRFEMHTDDGQAFQNLLAWKTVQYEQLGRLPIFKYPWTVSLLDAIRGYRSERFAGVMSALYAGEHLAAVHLGLLANRALHVWFPTYNRALEQYSPGLILLVYLAEQSANRGIQRIDFGPGDDRYKQQFKSGDTRLLVGGVDLRIGRATLRKGWYSLNHWVQHSRYREYLEVPINVARRYRQWLAFR